MAFNGQRSELQRTLRRQHQDGTVEWIPSAGALGKWIVILDIQHRLNLD